MAAMIHQFYIVYLIPGARFKHACKKERKVASLRNLLECGKIVYMLYRL